MPRSTLPLIALTALVLPSCAPEAKPAKVSYANAESWINQVGDYEIINSLVRKSDLEEFLATLEAGSVDSFTLNDAQPYAIVVVDVAAKSKTFAKPHFKTAIHMQGGQVVPLLWQPAPNNDKGKYRAVYVGPDAVTKVETAVAFK